MSDYYAIVANVLSDKVLRTGAKVWIAFCNGDAESPKVIGLSRGGRMVEKYTRYKRLTNFRSQYLPPHLRERFVWRGEKRQEAEDGALALGKRWAGVRFFKKDGTLLRDGMTASEAFARVEEARK